MKKLILSIVGITFYCTVLQANDAPVQSEKNRLSVYMNVDFLSSHVWRGGKSGNAPSIEPLAELSWGNLTVGTWGAATFDKEYKELDLYAVYTIENFSVGVFDYYCPPKSPNTVRFGDLNKTNTHHLYSIDASFNGTQNIPVKITASTMLYGMDYNSKTGAYYFSTYLESKYTKNWRNNSVSATIGLTTHEGIYYHKAAFVNTELAFTKTFDLKYFNLPVFGKVIYNPATQESYVIGGLSIYKGLKI